MVRFPFLFAAVAFAAPVAAQVPRPTGTVEVTTGAVPCDGQECYDITVSCPEVATPARARLKVGASIGSTKGTIFFAAGGTGTFMVDEVPEQRRVLSELRASGYRTVQVEWIDSWLVASAGVEEGQVRLACRPATVARWVYNRLHEHSPATAFCAIGHSGGAMQVSYMLSHYGLEDILATVVPTGGPPSGRLDRGCLRDDPRNAALALLDYGVNVMDAGFGFWPEGHPGEDASYAGAPGPGPCAQGDPEYAEKFRQASVASGDGDYSYPQTMVWFVLEGIDNGAAAAQGMTYHDLLVEHGSPWVRVEVMPDMDHLDVVTTAVGANKARDILINQCHPRP